MKTVPTDASVEEFLSKIPESVREDCGELVELMRAATGSEPVMWGPSIVGFGHLTYGGKKKLDWFPLGLSPRKQNLTLYAMGGWQRFPELLEKLGKHSTGVGCLYVKSLAEIDRGVLVEMIARVISEPVEA